MPASLYQANFNLERISATDMDTNSSAVKLAMELASLCQFNGLQDIEQHASLSDHFNIGNGQTLAQINDELKAKKSQNMTECVPVPSSEHVAEIVGRQGELSFYRLYGWVGGGGGIFESESCLFLTVGSTRGDSSTNKSIASKDPATAVHLPAK